MESLLNPILTLRDQPYFNAKLRGAKGDGSTDDTAALHDARDRAGVGGHIMVPPGTYITTGLTLNVASQVWRLMPGAVIKTKSSGATAGPITVDAPNVTITGGGAVDGNRGVLTGNSHTWPCITGTVNANDLLVEGITVQNSIYWGVWGQASRTRVRRCTFVGNWGVPILLSSYRLAVILGSTMQDTYDMEASDNYIDRTAESAATIANAAIQIRGNTDTTGGAALHTTYRGKALRNTILMPSNPSESAGLVCGIEFGARSYYGLAEGNMIVGGTMGISFALGNYGKAIGNTLIGQTFIGIEIADSPWVITQGNIIDGSGLLGSAASGGGIVTTGSGLSTDLSISNNQISNLNDGGRGISLASGAARSSINGNIITAVNGITVNQSYGATIAQNTVFGKGYSGSSGITVYDCGDAIVAGNLVRSFDNAVLLYAASSLVDYINVNNNHFRQCTSQVASTATGSGSIGSNIINSANMVKST